MKFLGHRLADLFPLAFTEDQAPGSSSTTLPSDWRFQDPGLRENDRGSAAAVASGLGTPLAL